MQVFAISSMTVRAFKFQMKIFRNALHNVRGRSDKYLASPPEGPTIVREIQFLFLEGKSRNEIKESLDAVHGDSSHLMATVNNWFNEFQRGRTSHVGFR